MSTVHGEQEEIMEFSNPKRDLKPYVFRFLLSLQGV